MSAIFAHRRATAALNWLGLPGVVLMAALLCDLIIIVATGITHMTTALTSWAGTATQMHWLFTIAIQVLGLFAIAACALWARDRPIPATWTGAAVLVLTTMLLRLANAIPHTALLTNMSFTETVAGVQLVYFCVRSTRGIRIVLTVTGLTVATLLTISERGTGWQHNGNAYRVAFVLLVLAIILGLRARKPVQQQEPGRISVRLRRHWLLVGMLTVALFLEVFYTGTGNFFGLPILALSVGAAVAALFASRHPLAVGAVIAAIIAVSGLLFFLGGLYPYPAVGGISFTQVVSGVAVVIFSIRYLVTRSATRIIGLLTLAVALAVLVNHLPDGIDVVSAYFLYALLLLGIAIATGLYLRTRDSERQRIVDSAVHDAQTAERMALARELHDVVAHHVTGIVVQAQATKMATDQDSPMVHTLDQIEKAGTDALTAMRRLVSSMRRDGSDGSGEFQEHATTDLAADLRATVTSSGHRLPTRIELDLPAELPQEIARSALRLVQESLTNISKHASDATLAIVSAKTVDDALHIRVSDNGVEQREQSPEAGGGYGLVGMRERVELLHGTLSAGPGPDGGWIVDVWLPLREESMP